MGCKHLRHPITLALFPALLFTLTFARTNPGRTLFFTSLLIALGWLGGHFNFIPLILVSLAAVTMMDAWRSTERTLLKRSRPFLIFLAGSTIGTTMGLLKLIPALAYVGLSERAGGLSVAEATRQTLGLSSLTTAVFPHITLPLIGGETGQLFYGAMGLGLLIIGLLRHERALRWAIVGLALCILIALPYSPLYALIQQLPFFSFLRTPTRWLFVAHACVAVIVAITADDIAKGKLRFVRSVGTALLTIGILTTFASFLTNLIDALWAPRIIQQAQQYFDTHLFAKTSGLPLEHYHRTIENIWHQNVLQLSLTNLRFIFPVVGLLLTGWALRYEMQRKKLHHLGILAALTIVSLLPSFFFHQPKAPVKHLTEARAVWADANLGDARVLPLFSGLADQLVRTSIRGDLPEERLRYQIALLVPNTHALVGVRSVDFYQPLQPIRMARILAALGSSAATGPKNEHLILEKMSLEQKIQIFLQRLPLARRLGVEYISSVWDLPLEKVSSLSFVSELPDIQLYRVPDPRPLAFIPSQVYVMQPNEDEVMRLLRITKNTEPAIIECESCTPGKQYQAYGALTVIDQSETSMTIEVTAEADLLLQILRPRIPGWRVLIDGTPVKTAMGDGMFFAIPVPKGKHEVKLEVRYGWMLLDSARFLLEKKDPWML